MDAYNIRDAAHRLDDLVGRAQAGESVEIERDGRVVARLVPIDSATPAKGIDVGALRRHAATLPFDPVDTVAEMRKQDRY